MVSKVTIFYVAYQGRGSFSKTSDWNQSSEEAGVRARGAPDLPVAAPETPTVSIHGILTCSYMTPPTWGHHC